MTTKFKDFGGEELQDFPEVKFKLYGEEFICKKAVPGKILLEVAGSVDEENPSSADRVISNFFSVALEEESFARFKKLIIDSERIVTVETLGEIVGWLVEQYSARPTKESSDS
jgi:hypothetical protein